ncbi:hypothetical protein BZZ01_04755 [Nostocales cyanobacterium HT-58-2]|nr:hypothetical protein BZZ01_04755 [Nostocales cyanobacterium HT-58-2]
MKSLTRDELKQLIDKYLFPIPEVQAWNKPKSRHQEHVFVSRYYKPSPDDDFIDLDALARNITISVIREAIADSSETHVGWRDL